MGKPGCKLAITMATKAAAQISTLTGIILGLALLKTVHHIDLSILLNQADWPTFCNDSSLNLSPSQLMYTP